MSVCHLDVRATRQTPDDCRVTTIRRRRKTLATIVGVIVMLGLGEAAVRIRAWYRFGTLQVVADIYTPNARLGRSLRPGAVINGSRRQVSINRWGFRGPEVPQAKPPNTVRIAAVGDSSTFGMEAGSDDAVWVARMTARLQANASRRKYDAINGGVPGYTLANSAIRLAEEILPFGPDFVVIFQATTDISAHVRRQFRSESSTKNSGGRWSRLVRENSLLFNLIRLNTTAIASTLSPRRRRDRLDDRGIEEYRKHLANMVNVARRAGARVLLCSCPRAFGDERAPTAQLSLGTSALAANPALSLAGLNDAYERYNDAVRRVAKKMDVTLVDLAAIVPKRRAFFVDSVHLNDAGHRLVGETIAVAVEHRQAGLPQQAGLPFGSPHDPEHLAKANAP